MDNTSIKAELRIMGDEFNVQEITEVLGIAPTGTWCKGDAIRNSGKSRTYTAWMYSTDVKETLDINEQAEKLKSLFHPKVKEIAFLKEKYDLDISIDFVIIIENEIAPAIYFLPQFIQFASKIEARIDIDTYVN